MLRVLSKSILLFTLSSKENFTFAQYKWRLRARLPQPSVSKQCPGCGDACETALIDHNGAASKWVATSYSLSSDSIDFNESSIAGVTAELTLHWRWRLLWIGPYKCEVLGTEYWPWVDLRAAVWVVRLCVVSGRQSGASVSPSLLPRAVAPPSPVAPVVVSPPCNIATATLNKLDEIPFKFLQLNFTTQIHLFAWSHSRTHCSLSESFLWKGYRPLQCCIVTMRFLSVLWTIDLKKVLCITYNQVGYNQRPITRSRLVCIKIIHINTQQFSYNMQFVN